MGTFSLGHWIVVLIIIMIVFGAKRLPTIGSGLGQGIRNFKKSMKPEDKLEDNKEGEEIKEAKAEETKESTG